MNARRIVDRLLEADVAPTTEPTISRTGVYIFGPGLPDIGYNAKDLAQALDDLESTESIPAGSAGNPKAALRSLVQRGFTFFIKNNENDIAVIGKVPAETSTTGQNRAMQFLGLKRGDVVAHQDTPDSAAEELKVDYALFGSRDLERRSKERQAPDQQNKGNGNVTVSPVPVSVGFQFKMSSSTGIEILEVVPGGPAAQAGLHAGDKITGVYAYQRIDGIVQQKQEIKNVEDLNAVLRSTSGGYPIPFRVLRGTQEITVPILPVPKPSTAYGAA